MIGIIANTVPIFAINGGTYDFVFDNMRFRVTNYQEHTVEFVSIHFTTPDDNPFEMTPVHKGDIIIPEKVSYLDHEFTVTSLGDFCCAHDSCTKISIPNTVKTIGIESFWDCTNLTTINIPYGVTALGSRTFDGCTSLKSIELPETIETLGRNCFIEVPLSVFICPKNLRTIGSGCFYECSDLERVEFNDKLRYIQSGAFSGCNLKELNLPDSLKEIGNGAFTNNPFKSVTIPKNITHVQGFPRCRELEEVILHDSVLIIDEFYDCDNLKKLDIRNCHWLQSVNLRSTALTSVVFPDSIMGWRWDTNRSGMIIVGSERIENVTIPLDSYSLSDLHLDTLVITAAINYIDGACRNSEIKNLYVKHTVPLQVNDKNTFSAFTYLSGVLHVPKGTKEAYSSADTWRNFSNIVDDLPYVTSVSEIKADSKPQTVYDLNGIPVNHLSRGNIYISNGKKFKY